MSDSRTYIKVHDGMPDHPKVDGLSDKAFRLLVESWCWCSRHLTDGRIPAARWRKCATPRARKELIDAGLVEQLDNGDVVMHDYLDWQRSAAEVADAKAAKGKGGTYGNHRRWHEGKGIVKPGCPYCPTPPSGGDDTTGRASDNRSDIRSEYRSDERHRQRSRTGNGEGDKRSVTRENFSDSTPPKTPVDNPPTRGNASDPRSDNRSQTDRFASPETTTETERISYGDPSSRGSVNQSSSARRRAREDDDDQTDDDSTTTEPGTGANAFIATIVETLRQETGRTVTPAWAAKVRDQILTGRNVRRPLPYLIKTIRERPRDFLPTQEPTPVHDEPWMREPAPDQDEINARGRERAKAALAAALAAKARATEGSEA